VSHLSPGAAQAATAALGALSGGEPVARVVVVAAPDAAAVGRQLLVWAGRVEGALGDAALQAEAVSLARSLLAGAEGAREGVREVAGHALFLEAYRPPPELVIVGAGHIARPLCSLGAMLGFEVSVLDDRPEFATRERFPEAREVRRADFAAPLRGLALGPTAHLVLVTRGHKYDFEALRDVLLRPELPAYVGMVGSRRRTRAALTQLAGEGIPSERLEQIHAPIGLDLGAETPEEIAVAIAAELVKLRRGGTGRSLREVERVFDRIRDSGFGIQGRGTGDTGTDPFDPGFPRSRE
jgi:xanthine dehydrogenase accessory factor